MSELAPELGHVGEKDRWETMRAENKTSVIVLKRDLELVWANGQEREPTR